MSQDASKRHQEASKRPSRGPKIDFSSQLGPPEPQKSMKIYFEYHSVGPQCIFCTKFIIYGVFATIWLQFGIKIRPRRLQDASKRPQDAPSWCPRRPKSRPRSAPDASRTSKAAQEASWRRPRVSLEPDDAQERPQSCPKAAQTPHPDFDLGPFWQRFD